jgi:hypothetical protein
MNARFRSTVERAQSALLITLALVGCSKGPSSPTEPLVTAPQPSARDTRALQSTLTANDIRSQYTAHVKDGRVVSIDEKRISPSGQSAQGTYSFYEARLVKYSGDAINTLGNIEVEFDLRGAIKHSNLGNDGASTAQISAIRNRAELLRSHALTQQEVQAHRTS